MKARCLALWVLASLAVVSLAPADTVLLTNGNRYDNVIARRDGDTIRIRFSYGEIGLPVALVQRVETSESSLEPYLAQAALLEGDTGTSAQQWVELALDAKTSGLDDGYRRALRRAAELEPGLPALVDLMHGLDFVLDRQRGRWIPYAESRLASSRQQAFEERRAAEAVERESRALAAERGRWLDVLETMAIAELAQELDALRREPPPVPVAVAPVIRLWGWRGEPGGWLDTAANRQVLDELTRRQPGSLLPVSPPRRHRRSSIKPAGQR